MGKGTRKRKNAAEDALIEQQNIDARNARIKKKALIISAVAIVLAVIIGIFVVFNVVLNSGVLLRNKIVISAGDTQVDAALASYFVNKEYNDFVNKYSEEISDYINTDEPLDEQKCSYDSSISWEQYFINRGKDIASQNALLSAAAEERGLELSQQDKDDIESSIADLETAAAEYGVSSDKYASMLFGRGVKADDVRRGLTMSALSGKYYNVLMDEFDFAESEINDYYTKNALDYQYTDFIKYTLDANYSYDAEDEEIESAIALAKSQAEYIAAAKSREEFEQRLFNYLDKYENFDTDDQITEFIESCVQTEVAYSKTADAVWAFGDQRKNGDTKVIETTAESYTVYYLISGAYRIEETSVDIRHIFINIENYDSEADAKAKAEEIYSAVKSAEDKDAAFSKYMSYSDDSTTGENDGVYEGVRKGGSDEAADEWCFDSSRKTGDIGFIEIEGGYEIVMLTDINEECWKEDVIDDLSAIEYSARLEQMEKTYDYTVNDDAFDKIKIEQS
ncbi:MAG: peptidylprolyl isomerase [Clostridia bacterium]|nr:peptidylprolyl isomerase [Clostridia bacterium]MEE1025041.1 peptidylprolyl isomerase [Acutalibacteraceae bacterium]